MKLAKLLLLLSGAASLFAQTSHRLPYTVVEVDRFTQAQGVNFPPDYQIELVENIVHQAMRASSTIEVIREGEKINASKATMRISGIVTEFKPGSRTKRYLVGLGYGATVVKAHVTFADAASGEVLLEKDLRGLMWIGVAGGNSEAAADHLGKNIVSFVKSKKLIPTK